VCARTSQSRPAAQPACRRTAFRSPAQGPAQQPSRLTACAAAALPCIPLAAQTCRARSPRPGGPAQQPPGRGPTWEPCALKAA
jgi:hypothetical protein